MPKLRPETLHARREHILDAAETCFAQYGFHRCTMAMICAQAGISAGALYAHFPSKEALIEGSCERERTNLASQFADVTEAPDLTAALARIAEHYAFDEPQFKRVLTAEIGLEATRNATVREIFDSVDQFVLQSIEEVIERSRQEGRIAPDLDSPILAQLLTVIGDGLMWRRAVAPDFDVKALLPLIINVIETLLKPIPYPKNDATPSEPVEFEGNA